MLASCCQRRGGGASLWVRRLATSTAASPLTRDSEDVAALRATAARFTAEYITPNVTAWDQADGSNYLPLSVLKAAGDLGLLSVGFPPPYGEPELHTNPFFLMALHEELCKAGSGGVPPALFSHYIGLMPVAACGSDELCAMALPLVLAGDKVAALAVTEPSGGSDVANIRTTARRDGDDFIINGEKTFITGGLRADFLTVAVRTGGTGPGGVSMLLVPGDTPGLTRTPLRKMGWHCSDTATLHFDGCRVPAGHLVGPENQGFKAIMHNFNNERLMMAVHAIGMARAAYTEALEWARARHTFGRPLVTRQAVSHMLVDMLTRIEAADALLYRVADAMLTSHAPVAEISMLKNFSTSVTEAVASRAVQIMGGAGYMHGTVSERVFRETKVLQIGGGSTEIMADLAAKQLGLADHLASA